MSEQEQQEQKQKKSVLEQVQGEIADVKRKEFKNALKELIIERNKAMEVLEGIDEKIVKLCAKQGDKEEEVRAALKA